jgi:hypothetical protein
MKVKFERRPSRFTKEVRKKNQETFTNRAKDQAPNKKLVLRTNSKLEPIRKGFEEGLKQ